MKDRLKSRQKRNGNRSTGTVPGMGDKMERMKYISYETLQIIEKVLRSRWTLVRVEATKTIMETGNVEFGVNWSACGTKTVKERNEFVRQMKKAVTVANALNDMCIWVDIDVPKMGTETYSERTRRIEKLIEGLEK